MSGLLEHVAAIAADHDQLLDTDRRQRVPHPAEDRASTDRHEALRHLVRVLAEPLAAAGLRWLWRRRKAAQR